MDIAACVLFMYREVVTEVSQVQYQELSLVDPMLQDRGCVEGVDSDVVVATSLNVVTDSLTS